MFRFAEFIEGSPHLTEAEVSVDFVQSAYMMT